MRTVPDLGPGCSALRRSVLAVAVQDAGPSYLRLQRPGAGQGGAQRALGPIGFK